MKKFIFMLLFVVIGLSASFAQESKQYVFEDNTFSVVKTSKSSTSSEKTPYKWKDSKGIDYDIYITANGSCYINRISSKTNKPYKYYLPKEVSIKICTELGREYKNKTITTN